MKAKKYWKNLNKKTRQIAEGGLERELENVAPFVPNLADNRNQQMEQYQM